MNSTRKKLNQLFAEGLAGNQVDLLVDKSTSQPTSKRLKQFDMEPNNSPL